ncbi:MAG: 4Fe-4S dicluster domain-containing protein [Thermoleophilia bacterium]
MTELQDLAQKLLAEGTVQVVIGWEEGRRGPRPVTITRAEDAVRLVFDTRCVHNLATYLNPRRSQVSNLGKPAIVVKGCDTKAVAGLLREAQLVRDDVVLIGVRCGGVVKDPTGPAELTLDTVAPRCAGCDIREPHLADYLIGEAQPEPPQVTSIDDRVAELDAMTPGERFEFWADEMQKCIRCYACRQVCPLCTCERCVADKSEPQWIEESPHARGNFSWHLTRALHLAGRCVGCGECERACPVGIPLTLLNRKLQHVVADSFDYVVSDDPAVASPIGAFRQDDSEDFIR